jgi:hypothetical protein
MTLRRSLPPAPPPISIRPAPLSGPELPAAARDVTSDHTPAMARRTTAAAAAAADAPTAVRDATRSALADATAHLFRAARLTEPPVRRQIDTSGGAAVSPSQPVDIAVPLSGGVDQRATGPGRLAGRAELTAVEMDQIIDRIIDKIEQRVVDELERRGRRYTPGVF